MSFVSGATAGIASSIVSQPADTVLSRLNDGTGTGGGGFLSTAGLILDESGVPGLFAGLGSRCVWAGGIIAGQFFLYDLFKDLLGIAPADLVVYLDPLRTLITDI